MLLLGSNGLRDDGLEPGEMLFGDMIRTQNQVQNKLGDLVNEDDEQAGMEIWANDNAKKWPSGLVPSYYDGKASSLSK